MCDTRRATAGVVDVEAKIALLEIGIISVIGACSANFTLSMASKKRLNIMGKSVLGIYKSHKPYIISRWLP